MEICAHAVILSSHGYWVFSAGVIKLCNTIYTNRHLIILKICMSLAHFPPSFISTDNHCLLSLVDPSSLLNCYLTEIFYYHGSQARNFSELL